MKIIVLFFLSLLSVTVYSNPHYQTIDRYTLMPTQETIEQKNELNVLIEVSFPKSINNVIEAVQYLLLRSSYKFESNYQSEILNYIKLPAVHKKLGPITLIRAIKVLAGVDVWEVKVNKINRTIKIISKDNLTKEVNNLTKEIDQKISVNIKQANLKDITTQILPHGWFVKIADKNLSKLIFDVVSEDRTRKEVIKEILEQLGAKPQYFPKIKMLIIRKSDNLPETKQPVKQ